MASVQKRGDTFLITVSLGRDENYKQIRKTTTFTPPPDVAPGKALKLAQAFQKVALPVGTVQRKCAHSVPLIRVILNIHNSRVAKAAALHGLIADNNFLDIIGQKQPLFRVRQALPAFAETCRDFFPANGGGFAFVNRQFVKRRAYEFPVAVQLLFHVAVTLKVDMPGDIVAHDFLFAALIMPQLFPVILNLRFIVLPFLL
jgi:hypothetical protein